MSMYKSICVTNRHLVNGDFEEQIRRVAESAREVNRLQNAPALQQKDDGKRSFPCDAVILREKDMPEQEYEALAGRVMSVLKEHSVPCILHTYVDVALRLGADEIHLPFPLFQTISDEKKKQFRTIGVSVHSVDEAVAACKAGATYITAGHIFATDCKKGVPPRGLDFLQKVCQAVPIPVYAIGGICPEQAESCVDAGAAGICMMSYYMTM